MAASRAWLTASTRPSGGTRHITISTRLTLKHAYCNLQLIYVVGFTPCSRAQKGVEWLLCLSNGSRTKSCENRSLSKLLNETAPQFQHWLQYANCIWRLVKVTCVYCTAVLDLFWSLFSLEKSPWASKLRSDMCHECIHVIGSGCGNTTFFRCTSRASGWTPLSKSAIGLGGILIPTLILSHSHQAKQFSGREPGTTKGVTLPYTL